jgi:hypothetical protein
MRGHDASAGHRGDVRDLVQEACISQKTDDPEMVQGRAKSSAGQGKPDFFHCTLSETCASTESRKNDLSDHRRDRGLEFRCAYNQPSLGTLRIADTIASQNQTERPTSFVQQAQFFMSSKRPILRN